MEMNKEQKKKVNTTWVFVVIIALIFDFIVVFNEEVLGWWWLGVLAIGILINMELIYYTFILGDSGKKRDFSVSRSKGLSLFASAVVIFVLSFVPMLIRDVFIPRGRDFLIGLGILAIIVAVLFIWHGVNKQIAVNHLGEKRVKN